ncbi:hypothetical protein OGM63_13635, partial [Plectonema radiosum NIES-515]|nr:hypothetical protein [Plectonema radiosum NIES-515]
MSLKNFQFKTHNSKLLTALISGILMGLTVAPFNVWFLAWIALAPLWVLIVNSAQRKTPISPFPPTPQVRDPKAPHLPIPLSPPPPLLLALAWGIGYHG